MLPVGKMGSPKIALEGELLPPKKKRSIFVWLLMIVGVLVAGISLAKIVRFARSPLARAIFDGYVEEHRLLEAQTAGPGTKELRKKGPCLMPIVETPEIRKRSHEMAGGGPREGDPPADETLVWCTSPITESTPPTCDGIARIYVDAVHPTNSFHVIVMSQRHDGAVCVADYNSRGRQIELDAGL